MSSPSQEGNSGSERAPDSPAMRAPSGRPAREIFLTGVTESFTAAHRDLIMDEGLHEHTWAVTAWFPAEPLRDGRALKAALRTLLDAFPATLPDDLWPGEAIAQRVMVLANCVGVDVDRAEGFHVRLRA